MHIVRMVIHLDLEGSEVEFSQVVTITTKGQITIPKYFLAQLNLKVGRKVTLELHHSILIIKPEVITAKDLSGCLGKKVQRFLK